MFGPRWLKNISNIRFQKKKTPLNWCRGFLYTFIWHSYREGGHISSISHGKMCYFHPNTWANGSNSCWGPPFCAYFSPQPKTTQPICSTIHQPKTATSGRHKSPQIFPPFPTSPPGQAMAAHFVSAHASIWTSQTTSRGPRFRDWRVVSGGSILR